MTAALFLGNLGSAEVGGRAWLEGAEARHAAVVKRIELGEVILIGDGAGGRVGGPVTELSADLVAIQIAEVLPAADRGPLWRVVQGLAKGERQELAIELLTEVGVDQILAWQAQRSIVRWDGAKAAKALARWQATAREASKQSRRAATPQVGQQVLGTADLKGLSADPGDLVLVLHEDADLPLDQVDLSGRDRVTVVVGPEGGITPAEVDAMVSTGAQCVSISDGVLRTSTAGAVALVQLQLMRRQGAQRDAG